MPEYERFALIIDTEPSVLGAVAVRLLQLGIDVLYAADVDEASLLAVQESERLGAVLIPSSFDIQSVKALLSRVCSKLASGPRSLIVSGLEEDSDLTQYLRDNGVEWALREPYKERELRFVTTAAMATDHGGERRKHIRIPVEIETTVFMGRHRKKASVHDLSVSGAYFCTANPFFEGSRISLEIPLPEGSVLGNGIVVNAKSAENPGRPDVPDGMGVIFTNLAPGCTERLSDYIDGWVKRFRF